MKNIQLILILILAISSYEYKAQTKLLHYWHFNNTLPTSGAGGLHFGTGKMNSDYTRINFPTGYLRFVKVASCLADTGYWDNLVGDSINQRPGYGSCCPVFGSTINNSAVRTRNPTDSMQFLWYIPTKNFNNIKLTWESQASSTSSGPHRLYYKYSLDSGSTWITTILPKLYDSAGLGWGKIILNLSAISSVNNNNRLMLSIKTGTPNTGTSGNIRYDNITVEGDSIISISTDILESQLSLNRYSLYPNPSNNNIVISSASNEPITIVITNLLNQIIYTEERKEGLYAPISIMHLKNGIYYVNITEQNSKKQYILKFVKN